MDTNKQELLMRIGEARFACVDLQLYLDTHPADETAMGDYLCYAEKLQTLLDRYEQAYGPLRNFGESTTSEGSWVFSKWPWEL